MDIAEEILNQHHVQRQMFARLYDVDPADTATLAILWERLSAFLEVHAAAEERYFYPRLLELGGGPPASDENPVEETKDAIKDHNEIRDAIADTNRHEVGSEDWWAGVRAADEANSDHMAEEERDDLPDVRRHFDLQTRHAIAVQFVTYESEHVEGVPLRNEDPDRYIQEHK
ncbi:MAG TPA: hemerythrin domain-containing protein [Jatrophihabitans sp.]|nr:hemerythrin domain-containing protein [Jatrophihabitans sp.]